MIGGSISLAFACFATLSLSAPDNDVDGPLTGFIPSSAAAAAATVPENAVSDAKECSLLEDTSGYVPLTAADSPDSDGTAKSAPDTADPGGRADACRKVSGSRGLLSGGGLDASCRRDELGNEFWFAISGTRRLSFPELP